MAHFAGQAQLGVNGKCALEEFHGLVHGPCVARGLSAQNLEHLVIMETYSPEWALIKYGRRVLAISSWVR